VLFIRRFSYRILIEKTPKPFSAQNIYIHPKNGCSQTVFGEYQNAALCSRLHFSGFRFSILLQYNENGETQIFIFYELPTLFVFLCYFVGSLFNGNHVYYPCITELHCIVVIEVIFLFRVARDVFYPPCPRLPQNLAKQTYPEMSGILRNEYYPMGGSIENNTLI